MKYDFKRKIILSVIMFVAVVISFTIYVRSEKEIDKANEQRHISSQLADELRQSSDDLTRMARTYVVTRDPIYKQAYNDILAIRDGKKPRPASYNLIYWDLKVPNDYIKIPETGAAVPLLEIMRQSGFTSEEFSKLAESKANSDKLTAIEFEAMRLVEASGPDAEANRIKALMMMHDSEYHRAKAGIMSPINEFLIMLEERTHSSVKKAEISSIIYRIVFIGVASLFMIILLLTYRSLKKTLGGFPEQVHNVISRIGSGDFSSPITIPPGHENTVLSGLLQMQIKLRELEIERNGFIDEIVQNNERLTSAKSELTCANHKLTHLKDIYAALSQTNQCIVRCQDRKYLYDSVVKIAVEYGHFKMAWVGLVDEISREIIPAAIYGESSDYLNGISINDCADSPFGNGPTGTCIRTGECIVVNNFSESSITSPWHERGKSFGIKSSAAFPISNRSKNIGALTLYSDEIDFFTEDLIALLNEMAMDISFALDRMDLEISHRRQEDGLREMVERLTVSNTELERFAYVASHDLQEPLRTIVSFTQLVEKDMGDRLPADQKEKFDFVIDAAKRMHLLILDLLAYSRVTTKGISFSLVSLDEACSSAIDNLRESVSESVAEIEVGELPEVMGDGVQIMQVFQNLIGNAIKYRHSDRTPQISIMSERQGGEWVISVRDNGIGIGNTSQDIFEIFRRLHPSNRYPGSGVGLAICKRIIHRHNGRIWMNSVEGVGSTFSFTMPAI